MPLPIASSVAAPLPRAIRQALTSLPLLAALALLAAPTYAADTAAADDEHDC